MATFTNGQIAGFFSGGLSTGTITPMRTQTDAVGPGARCVTSMYLVAGLAGISGHAYESGAPAKRIITILTQPPKSIVLYQFTTDAVTGAFSFSNLPVGNYTIIDSMTDNSRQALVYDWVVAS